MKKFAEFSERLVAALGLAATPVAVTFSDDAPAGASEPSSRVPAGCKFWELGAEEKLVTQAAHHQLCSIGIHTHNFGEAPTNQDAELTATLAAMRVVTYAATSERRKMPTSWRVSQLSDPKTVQVFCDGQRFSDWGVVGDGTIEVNSDINDHTFRIVTTPSSDMAKMKDLVEADATNFTSAASEGGLSDGKTTVAYYPPASPPNCGCC